MKVRTRLPLQSIGDLGDSIGDEGLESPENIETTSIYPLPLVSLENNLPNFPWMLPETRAGTIVRTSRRRRFAVSSSRSLLRVFLYVMEATRKERLLFRLRNNPALNDLLLLQISFERFSNTQSALSMFFTSVSDR